MKKNDNKYCTWEEFIGQFKKDPLMLIGFILLCIIIIFGFAIWDGTGSGWWGMFPVD